jgi:hypothetical protein
MDIHSLIHNISLKIQTLEIPKCKFTSTYYSDEYLLYDSVIIYNVNDQWKVIKLDYVKANPILHDNDYTIVLCPLTLRCSVFKGIYEFYKYNNYQMLLKNKSNNKIISLDGNDPVSLSDDNEIIRYNIIITIYRCSMMITQDPIFHIDNYSDNMRFIIPIELYYSNIDNLILYNIHPKTLVYVLQYKTFKNKKLKISVILGKNISDKLSGYDYKKSGILEYLIKIQEKIINKKGFVMPMLWYLVKDIYTNAKIIYLT